MPHVTAISCLGIPVVDAGGAADILAASLAPGGIFGLPQPPFVRPIRQPGPSPGLFHRLSGCAWIPAKAADPIRFQRIIPTS